LLMESAATPARGQRPLDGAVLAVAARNGEAAIAGESDPASAIDAVVEAVQESIPGALPSVFVLEHGRLWLVAQRGYPFVPDGIEISRGVMGRAVGLGRPQLVADVTADPEYLGASPAVASELALPLRAGRVVVGVFNLETERPLPEDVVEIMRPL